MEYSIQVLFLHHLTNKNKDVVIQNFNSFKKYNNNIIPIHDADTPGLDNSIPISLSSKIPKTNHRWTDSDTTFLNYILNNENNLEHTHYMLCEWDCYTECNLEKLYKPYKDYDVVVPNIVHYKNEPCWQWFKEVINIKDKEKLIGFRPQAFLLFKKESLIKLAKFYVSFWNDMKNLNNESRLGIFSKALNFKIKEFKNIKRNVEWHEIKFIKNNKIYHPVKQPFTKKLFLNLKSKKYIDI